MSDQNHNDSQNATDHQVASYGFGRQMGEELSKHPLNDNDNDNDGIVLDSVIAGLKDAFLNTDSIYTNEQYSSAYQVLQEVIQAKAAEKHKTIIESGKVYLENNAKKAGVTVTDSGLQYEIMVEGNGDKPTASSQVRTHYHGCLASGEVFDSSVERNEPAEFAVGGVIAGWTEALQLMPAGSKWRLVIPSNLAYGEQGAGGVIPPYATLVFEVELLEIL